MKNNAQFIYIFVKKIEKKKLYITYFNKKIISKMNNDEKTILEIKTSHVGTLKQVFKMIKKIKHIISISFSPNVESNAISISELTQDNKIFMRLRFFANAFDHFKCDGSIIIIVVANDLYQILKMFDDNDTITLYMINDRNSLYIKNSNQMHEIHECEIRSTNHTYTELTLPLLKYETKINVIQKDFHSLCRKIKEKSRLVELVVPEKDKIFFSAKHDDLKVDKNNVVLDIKNLMIFTKCDKLCDDFKIYFSRTLPLTLKISITNVGKMLVFIEKNDEKEIKMIHKEFDNLAAKKAAKKAAEKTSCF